MEVGPRRFVVSLVSGFRGERETEVLVDQFIAWILVMQVIGIFIVIIVIIVIVLSYLTIRACVVRLLVTREINSICRSSK